MKANLGSLEARLLASAQLRGVQVVRAPEVAKTLRIDALQARRLLGRLSRRRAIARVCPGVYLLPKRLPLGGMWSPDEALALATLMAERGARYQVTGPNAFNRYGFDEQMPNRLYVYNDKLSGEREIGSIRLTLIEVDAKRLGDTELLQNEAGVEIPYSSRTRALVDAVYDWSRFHGLPRGFAWIRRELATDRIEASALVACTLRYGDVSTLRRMGALLEREGVAEKLIRKLEAHLMATKSTIPFVPNAPKRGAMLRRWGIVWNERDG
ncbi:MAG: hypothetical protein HZA53_00230 [Planctomycetes bacterium]|nr:hypothetical protein [Planctomycetota bacterium]